MIAKVLLASLLGWQLAAETVSLARAMQLAGERYPAAQVSAAQIELAAAQVRVARLAYLPRLDVVAQGNRATRNNILGMVLPQNVIPNISGPVLAGESFSTSVWGSAAGTLFQWEPFDFGYRRALVDVASRGEARAQAAAARTRYDAMALAADAYLTVLASRELEKAADAAIARSQTFVDVIGSLVRSELRPGADLSRSNAELAAARAQKIEARRAAEIARVTLAELTGQGDVDVQAVTAGTSSNAAGATHPAIVEQERAIEQAQAQRRVVDKSVYPHINFEGALYARGTGALPDGTTLGGVNGLGPNVANWGAGMTVTLPVAEYAALRTRREAEAARERIETARLQQIKRDLAADEQRAAVNLEAANASAQLAPVELQAAREAERQARARYQAGLGSISEVAEAQRLLAAAEADDSLATLAIARAHVALARARGTLEQEFTRGGR